MVDSCHEVELDRMMAEAECKLESDVAVVAGDGHESIVVQAVPNLLNNKSAI
jgi:hypothetical protein